jgi:hypothetical protein
MPTNEQMQSVIDQIKRYESSSFIKEGAFYRESSDGPLRWNDIPETERLVFLDGNVNWEGFSREQEFEVVSRVADGEDPEFWMDGIQPVIEREELIHGYQELVDQKELEQAVTEVERQWVKPDALGIILDNIHDGYEMNLQEGIERGRMRPANDNEKGRER